MNVQGAIHFILNKLKSHDDSVDSLNDKVVGVALSSGDDLNDYNDVGEYSAVNHSTAATIVNRPSDLSVAFVLLVLNKGGNNFQVIFSHDGKIYTRSKVSTGWLNWVKFTGTSM